MMQYEYFGPSGNRRSRLMADEDAHSVIGRRLTYGFLAVQRGVICPDGMTVSVVYFLDSFGHIWGLYYETEGF